MDSEVSSAPTSSARLDPEHLEHHRGLQTVSRADRHLLSREALPSFAPCLAALLMVSCGSLLGATGTSPQPPPVRHVIVVEDSSNMKKQREATADLISRMILNGFGGRMRIGEVVEIWTLGDTVTTNALPAFRWHPVAAIDDSNSAYRLLRALKSSADSVELEDLLPHLDLSNPGIPRLLLYLATSGADPLRGTPFDVQVNSIFRQHHKRLAEAGHAFVTVLAAEKGEWSEHSVTPGDRVPYVPPFPELPTEPEPSNETSSTNAAPPEPPVTTFAPVTNPPPAKPTTPMTVDEIAARMRDAARQRALTSSPPDTVQGSQVPPTDVAASDRPAVSEPDRAPSADPNGKSTTTVVEDTSPVPDGSKEAPPPPATNVSTVATPTNAAVELPENSKPKEPNGLPLHEPETPADDTFVPEPGPAASSPVLNGPPAPDAPFQPLPRPRGEVVSPWKDLLTGVLLLGAAVALAWLLIRQITRRSHPSLISQSLGSSSNRAGRSGLPKS